MQRRPAMMGVMVVATAAAVVAAAAAAAAAATAATAAAAAGLTIGRHVLRPTHEAAVKAKGPRWLHLAGGRKGRQRW